MEDGKEIEQAAIGAGIKEQDPAPQLDPDRALQRREQAAEQDRGEKVAAEPCQLPAPQARQGHLHGGAGYAAGENVLRPGRASGSSVMPSGGQNGARMRRIA